MTTNPQNKHGRTSYAIVFPTLTTLMIPVLMVLSGCGDSGSNETTSAESKPNPVTSSAEPVPETAQKTPRVPHPIKRPEASLTELQKRIFEVQQSEELSQHLSPSLASLAKFFNGESTNLADVMEPSILHTPIKASDLSALKSTGKLLSHQKCPIGPESQVPASEVWAPLISQMKFENCKFGVLRVKLLDDQDVFRMETTFEGRLPERNGLRIGVKAKQTLDWIPDSENFWTICKWKQKSFELSYGPPLFEVVNQQAIPDTATRIKAETYLHEQLMLNKILTSKDVIEPLHSMYMAFSDWESSYQYPTVSVVDYDNDGWDDLFIMDRRGPTVMLRNLGDGTFTDTTEACGLKINDFTNSAFFADFDNDGDSDCLIGRTMKSSQFFVNENGKFVPDAETNKELESATFIVSGSVVDFNNDGLLDVYLSSYSLGTGPYEYWVPLSAPRVEDRELLIDRVKTQSIHVDRPGPPNVLLMNHGGKLKYHELDQDDVLRQWRQSYQATSMDFDSDGDLDLYVCNDFAPDAFLRNDTPKGSFDIQFVEVTKQVVPNGSMGFGMGASLGDYNSDGDLDLYVSNMYSKAGLRILEGLNNEVDPRIQVSARGNFLYDHRDGQYHQVAGLGAEDQHVSKVGWSFGGQFADFDNNAALDLYVPSGFYTAPEMVTTDVDM